MATPFHPTTFIKIIILIMHSDDDLFCIYTAPVSIGAGRDKWKRSIYVGNKIAETITELLHD